MTIHDIDKKVVSALAGQPTDQRIGICLEDPTSRRLMEGVVINLDLKPIALAATDLTPAHLFQYEMIIADEQTARDLRPILSRLQSAGANIKPALIAIVAGPYRAKSDDADRKAFDGVIALPERPALLTAQLSVALYSHRAFAQRYQSALEELALNRSIFKSVTSGISVASAQMKELPLMYVNPAFEVMTGYSLEDVEGKNCRFLQNEETDQPGLTLIREAIAGARETVAVLRNFRKDGSPFWNELSISPVRNSRGELTHFVGIQNDVTERVEFEIALRESEKLAAVGRLASSIAHEINNPLEAVMNLVYLAQQSVANGKANEETVAYLARADEELRRVKLITARSLRFYKQSEGPEAVRASDLIRSVGDVYALKLDNYGIGLLYRERSTQHIVCLASEIRQVLSNLVSNAIDAMRAHGGTLFMRIREATDRVSGRKGVIMTVADTGSGISPEALPNLFRAFYTTKGISGTGLGLWISAEIVSRHHGHIKFRSRQTVPSCTVFRLFLPYQGVSGQPKTEGAGTA